MNDNIQEIYIDKIDDPAHAMRETVRDESLYELADNIKANGLISPITVRPVGDRYEVVAGHRRFSAIKINGSIKIKAVIRELTDAEAFGIMAAENLERKDVDVVDEARFIREFMDRAGIDAKEASGRLRRSLRYVLDRIAIGEMPEFAQQYLKEGRIKLGVALALMGISNEALRESWMHRAAAEDWTVNYAQYQALEYKNNPKLYDGIIEEAGGNVNAVAPKMVMFRCSLDGKEYDARLVRHIPIYEGNLEIYNAFVSEFNKHPASPESTPAG